MLQGNEGTRQRAKQLRREMSPAEIALWLALRAKPAGLKLRKQHPSGPHVADFYCHAARFIIEVDGKNHDFGDRPARDASRDRWFAARGLAVMRIPAIDVLQNCDAAVRGIVAFAADRLGAQD